MPSGPSLYDMLTGHINDVPLDMYDDNTQEIMSVMENLKHILNARAGSLKHLPDYGLPDLTTVYAALPASAHSLKDHIEKTLLVYEPRIRSIKVDIASSLDPGLQISYVLTCHLKKIGLVRFGTHFESSGRTALHWQKTART